jgi:type II secretory pathway component PulM
VSAWIARLRAAFDGLAPRERLLVLGAAGMLGLSLLVFGIINPLISADRQAELRVTNAADQLLAVDQLRRRYDDVNKRLSRVEKRILDAPKGEIFTTLEKLARDSTVKIDSMEPRTSPASDSYSETKVQVVLKSVTLAQLVNYLHRIETDPQVLSVKSLRIRTRQDRQEMLDVTFTVSSFEPT